MLLLSASVIVGTAPARGEPKWALAMRMYSDRTAYKVGDILTVVIVEEAKSSKDSDKSTEKQVKLDGSVSLGSPLIDGVPRARWTNAVMPKWSLDTKKSYSGKGAMQNRDELSGKVGACVMEVLPNGNLIVEGRRTLVVQNERMEMVLTGIVRPEDIASDNTVKSTQVADASITYHSTGTIANNQSEGLFSRLLDWMNLF